MGWACEGPCLNCFWKSISLQLRSVYQHLKDSGYNVSYSGVSAMVGLMNTRLGIFRVSKSQNVYSLRDSYKDVWSLLSGEDGLVSLNEDIVF
jgi:hypothetical protein